jgi:DNA polymerase-3 subunit beta
MKILADRKGLLEALNAVSAAVPARSPKPILQNVLLRADPEGSTLAGTDLEVGIEARVLGVQVEGPGMAVLPPQRLGQFLKAVTDEQVSIEVRGDKLLIRGRKATLDLVTEDPALFPAFAPFAADAYFVVPATELRKGIARTIYATDVASTRYALGGVLFEFDGPGLALVATDGRRLSRQEIPCDREGDPRAPETPVVPTKALKLIDRALSGEDAAAPVHLAFTKTGVAVRVPGAATVNSRLVEGRFPPWQDVIPATFGSWATVPASDLLAAFAQAAIATAEESRGIDCTFREGSALLAAKAADVGESGSEVAMASYSGQPVELTLDHRYAADPLAALGAQQVRIELIDHKSPFVLRTDDGYLAAVMPLTRDR